MGRLGTAAPGRDLIAGSGHARGALISTACRQGDPPPLGLGRVKDVLLPCQGHSRSARNGAVSGVRPRRSLWTTNRSATRPDPLPACICMTCARTSSRSVGAPASSLSQLGRKGSWRTQPLAIAPRAKEHSKPEETRDRLHRAPPPPQRAAACLSSGAGVGRQTAVAAAPPGGRRTLPDMSLPQPSRTIVVEPVKAVAIAPAASPPPAGDEPPRHVEAPTAPPPPARTAAGP
jgi:hypothetical protein